MSAVVILPWAEFMLPRQEQSVMGRTDYLLRNCGIDMADVLHISEETAALKEILQDDRFGKILRINTADDLKELIELLLGRPLCLRITLIHTEVASKYSADKVSIWEGDFAVIINTTNHKIRNQLRGALQTAQSHASRQRPFSLEPKWWLCLGPCWLMSAPCYNVSSINSFLLYLLINYFDCPPK
ncbi:hypothetical protein FSP39_022653 [Pinctada imbricata]|uniref:Uncharacterized protein n=1 Tax=Pinctada imbricata TaxID=66713 RepID=A0AA89CDJ5_PINIB|nr:hypothetical protein FSP39_022653 [Pinctada imbricata]